MLYNAFFVPSIQEAAAFGFTERTGTDISELSSCVEEAHYKLTKYKSFEDWFDLASPLGGYINIKIAEFPHKDIENGIRDDLVLLRKNYSELKDFYLCPLDKCWNLFYCEDPKNTAEAIKAKLIHLGYAIE